MSFENVTVSWVVGASSALSAEQTKKQTAAGASQANPILSGQHKLPRFIAPLLRSERRMVSGLPSS